MLLICGQTCRTAQIHLLSAVRTVDHNEDVRQNTDLDGRELTIDLKEEDVDSWKSQMSVVVDSCPFENVGFGTQNTIKKGNENVLVTGEFRCRGLTHC